MTLARWLPFLGLTGCLLGVELGENVGLGDGAPCEEEEQCLRELTCSWLEAVCRPSCLDTADCDDDGRLCIVVYEGEVGVDLSVHYDGCIPEELLPEDPPDDVRISIQDDEGMAGTE